MFSNYLKRDVVVFFGKTGAGKTSTINRLFGFEWPTDNAKACTDKLQFESHRPPKGKDLLVVDTPGIAESDQADNTFYPLFEKAVGNAGHLIWVYQGDIREYRPDQVMMVRLRDFLKKALRITVLINQIDRIGLGNWDQERNEPSTHQRPLITERISDVYQKFGKYLPGLTPEDILIHSAAQGYNSRTIYNYIINR